MPHILTCDPTSTCMRRESSKILNHAENTLREARRQAPPAAPPGGLPRILQKTAAGTVTLRHKKFGHDTASHVTRDA